VVQQADYIEGTEFTRKQLEDFFPFGYAVIYLNEDGEKQIHEVHNKLMDWKIDWDQVKIEPDFQNGVATFMVPDVSASGTAGRIMTFGSHFVVQIPLKNGICRRIGIYVGNNPTPTISVLNANERKPVFLVGYRIPHEGEVRPPHPPYFFIQP
jgi:hypothetical protein